MNETIIEICSAFGFFRDGGPIKNMIISQVVMKFRLLYKCIRIPVCSVTRLRNRLTLYYRILYLFRRLRFVHCVRLYASGRWLSAIFKEWTRPTFMIAMLPFFLIVGARNNIRLLHFLICRLDRRLRWLCAILQVRSALRLLRERFFFY